MTDLILLTLIIGGPSFILIGIGLLTKKKFKGYLKIFNFFEGRFESED